jgi:hypothetical protein
VLVGYKRSARDTYVWRLRDSGLVSCEGDRIVATDRGLEHLGPGFEPLPTGDALLRHWRDRLPKGERACLEVAVVAYPGDVTRETISESTTYRRSARDTYVWRLRSRGLLVVSGANLRAADALFDGGRS